MKRVFAALLVGSCLTLGVPAVALAQSNPGFTFTWGDGPSGKQQLRYVLQYGTPGHRNDTYRLKVGRQKVAIDKIVIGYPDNYTGTINPQRVKVRVGGSSQFLGRKLGEEVALAEVLFDEEARLLEIVLAEPIPAGEPVEVVLSNIKNPTSGGMFYFTCQISSPGDVPILRYVGTWVLSIFRS